MRPKSRHFNTASKIFNSKKLLITENDQDNDAQYLPSHQLGILYSKQAKDDQLNGFLVNIQKANSIKNNKQNINQQVYKTNYNRMASGPLEVMHHIFSPQKIQSDTLTQQFDRLTDTVVSHKQQLRQQANKIHNIEAESKLQERKNNQVQLNRMDRLIKEVECKQTLNVQLLYNNIVKETKQLPKEKKRKSALDYKGIKMHTYKCRNVYDYVKNPTFIEELYYDRNHHNLEDQTHLLDGLPDWCKHMTI